MNASNVLFMDIETVSSVAQYQELSPAMQHFWQKKSSAWIRQSEEVDADLYARLFKDKAGIFAEFGKIICISIGFNAYDAQSGASSFRIKSFYGDNEKEVISGFLDLISRSFNDPLKHSFCGHNIREFDIPYICRRAVIHGLELPQTLQLSGKKPWEVKHLIDTLEEWKFGDFKHFISLALLAELFGIPTPKDDIDGSMVGSVYWSEKDLERIKIYCQKDVYTVARIYSKLTLGKFEVAENVIEVN